MSDEELAEEILNQKEFESLHIAGKKAIENEIKNVLNSWLESISEESYKTENTFSNDDKLISQIKTILISSILLGMKHASKEVQASDEIPSISYEQAISYLKTKVPMTKKEWLTLEKKVTFRAFTVAKLTSIDLINQAKKAIESSLKNGGSYASSWKELKETIDKSPLSIKPGYWENVYRTNTGSAYSAGKNMEFEKTKPVGIQLFIIDDERTTDICRHLLLEAGTGITLPVDHPFWKKYGYPPYHFQCRTGIRGIYTSQVNNGYKLQNPTIQEFESFEPQEGFGGNPVDKESWWRMPKSMALRSAQYGIFNDIEAYAKKNDLLNFSLDLVNGSTFRKLQGKDFNAELAKYSEPKQKEIEVAKILVDNNHSIYFTPENRAKNMKNPDAIIDGKIGEIKVITSKDINKIRQHIFECDKQKAQVACLRIPSSLKIGDVIDEAKRVLSERKLAFINEIYIVDSEYINIIKK